MFCICYLFIHTKLTYYCVQGLSISYKIITKTYLYNFDPLKPNFYTVKLGFTEIYIIFLISTQKHRLWVLVRTDESENFHCLVAKCSVFLNRRGFRNVACVSSEDSGQLAHLCSLVSFFSVHLKTVGSGWAKVITVSCPSVPPSSFVIRLHFKPFLEAAGPFCMTFHVEPFRIRGKNCC